MYDKIIEEAETLQCKILEINGVHNHIHFLVSMSPKISYSDFTKQIKGSTSHWINSNDFIEEKFAWQKGSRGFSVSKSKIITIINYIKKQKKHHKVVPFKSEFDKLLKVHGLEPENGNR